MSLEAARALRLAISDYNPNETEAEFLKRFKAFRTPTRRRTQDDKVEIQNRIKLYSERVKNGLEIFEGVDSVSYRK